MFYEKKVFLEISQNPQENICAKVSFLIKLQASGQQPFKKIDFGTGAFLQILWNFYEYFFTEHLWTTASVLNYLKQNKELDPTEKYVWKNPENGDMF